MWILHKGLYCQFTLKRTSNVSQFQALLIILRILIISRTGESERGPTLSPHFHSCNIRTCSGPINMWRLLEMYESYYLHWKWFFYHKTATFYTKIIPFVYMIFFCQQTPGLVTINNLTWLSSSSEKHTIGKNYH